MKAYRSKHNFVCFEGKFFKGSVYTDPPKTHLSKFVEIEIPKQDAEVSGQKVETAAAKQKVEKKKAKK